MAKCLTKWRTRPEAEKMLLLMKFVSYALDITDPKTWRTTVWGIAQQFGASYGVKKEDFDLIKNMTVQQIADAVIEESKRKVTK